VTKATLLLALCVFIVYPFYTILTKSVFSTKVDGITLYNFVRFFTKPYYYTTLLHSLVVCCATVLLATAIGVPIAYLMTRYNIAGKKILHIFIIMSLMSPPFIGPIPGSFCSGATVWSPSSLRWPA
jgi:iron(III) transport system permease protein